MRAFQLGAFQFDAFQVSGLDVSDTIQYSQHPVNCIMAGNEPLHLGGFKRIREWSIPPRGTKERVTARRSGVRQLSRAAPSFTTKSGTGGPLD